MRYRKIILVSFLTLFLLQNIGLAEKRDKIRLTISLDKRVYLTREPIWLNMTSVNISDTVQEIYALTPEPGYVQIILKNSQGVQLPYDGMFVDFVSGSGHGTIVRPDTAAKITGSYNLLSGFGERINKLWHFLKPDTYNVQILLQGSGSNTLEFRVEAPKGDEEKAYQLLAEAVNQLFMPDRGELVIKLKELVTRYPKSVYVDIAYYEMLYWDPDKKRAKGNAEDLLFNYPNSWLARDALLLLIAGEDTERQRMILKGWIGRFPGTKADEWARKTLKRIEDTGE